jgi:signal transduction histidine kinase
MGTGTQAGKDRLTRLAGSRPGRAAAVALLAAAALSQAVTQAVTLGGAGSGAVRPDGFPAVFAAEYLLPLILLALLATVPLAFCPPAMGAVAVTIGNGVALISFGQVTAGGATAELAAAGWLGLAGGAGDLRAVRLRYLALGLTLPFTVIALTVGGWAALLLAAAVPAAAGLGIAAWAGRLARTRTEAGEALADTLLAHTARGERARIARELHDVVAHHISMIAVLSETGRLATPGLPEAGAKRFAEIGDTARAGLTEMRRLLGVLREDAELTADGALTTDPADPGSAGAGGSAVGPVPAAGGPGPASRYPQPGLAQLTELIDAAREASSGGTRLILSGPVAPLDPGVELAAYRIVQEALTNARRHAPGAAADVELRYSAESLRLRVRDNGPGPARAAAGTGRGETGRGETGRAAGEAGLAPAAGRPPGGGHGLAGMRERAFSVGGSLYAGLAPGGGFLVEAVLPAGPDQVVVPPVPAGGRTLATEAGR